MTPAAVFFPVDPEANAFDLIESTKRGLGNGLRLYYDGHRFALLPRPIKGFALFCYKPAPSASPCAA